MAAVLASRAVRGPPPAGGRGGLSADDDYPFDTLEDKADRLAAHPLPLALPLLAFTFSYLALAHAALALAGGESSVLAAVALGRAYDTGVVAVRSCLPSTPSVQALLRPLDQASAEVQACTLPLLCWTVADLSAQSGAAWAGGPAFQVLLWALYVLFTAASLGVVSFVRIAGGWGLNDTLTERGRLRHSRLFGEDGVDLPRILPTLWTAAVAGATALAAAAAEGSGPAGDGPLLAVAAAAGVAGGVAAVAGLPSAGDYLFVISAGELLLVGAVWAAATGIIVGA